MLMERPIPTLLKALEYGPPIPALQKALGLASLHRRMETCPSDFESA